MPLRSRLQASPCSDSCAALSILYSAAASTALCSSRSGSHTAARAVVQGQCKAASQQACGSAAAAPRTLAPAPRCREQKPSRALLSTL